MFEGIGTIGSYLQQRNLQFKANYKLTTGQEFKTASEIKRSYMQELLKTTNSNSKDQANALRKAFIKQELMNGKELSDEEMRFLKDQDPELYAKAQKAEKAREDLRAELRRCKTKAQAQQAVVRAQMKAVSDTAAAVDAAKAGSGGGGSGGGSAAASGAMVAGGASAASMAAGSIAAAIGTAGGTAAAVSGGAAAAGGADAAAAATAAAGTAVAADTAASSASAAAAELTGASAAAAVSVTAVAAAADASAGTGTSSAGTVTGTSSDTSASAAQTDDYETLIMKIRALQDEWMKYISRKEYDEMPFDDAERIRREKDGGSRQAGLPTAAKQHPGLIAAYTELKVKTQAAVIDTKAE